MKDPQTVVSSSAESETGVTFLNAQNVISLLHILETYYLHRKPTKVSPIVTDNLISQGILASFIKNSKSKNWDMRYHWLEDRIFKKIQLIWKREILNWADYLTKHHPPHTIN